MLVIKIIRLLVSWIMIFRGLIGLVVALYDTDY